MFSLMTRRSAAMAKSAASRGVGGTTVRHMSVADKDNILPVSFHESTHCDKKIELENNN